MIELLQSTLNEYATTNPMKRFIDRGYLPRRRKDDITTQSLAKDLIGLTGYTINTPSERRYEDDVDYAHDREVDFPMLQLLKAKGYKNVLFLVLNYLLKVKKVIMNILQILKNKIKKLMKIMKN